MRLPRLRKTHHRPHHMQPAPQSSSGAGSYHGQECGLIRFLRKCVKVWMGLLPTSSRGQLGRPRHGTLEPVWCGVARVRKQEGTPLRCFYSSVSASGKWTLTACTFLMYRLYPKSEAH